MKGSVGREKEEKEGEFFTCCFGRVLVPIQFNSSLMKHQPLVNLYSIWEFFVQLFWHQSLTLGTGSIRISPRSTQGVHKRNEPHMYLDRVGMWSVNSSTSAWKYSPDHSQAIYKLFATVDIAVLIMSFFSSYPSILALTEVKIEGGWKDGEAMDL